MSLTAYYKDLSSLGGIVIPTDGILNYKFDNNYNDSGSLGVNLLGNSSGTFVNDRHGNTQKAIDNNGDPLYTASAIDLTNTKKISIAFWFKKSTNSFEFIASNYDGSTTNSFEMYFLGDNSFNITNYSAGGYQRSFKISNFNNDAWTHIVATIDREAASRGDLSKLYINGILQTLTPDDTAAYTNTAFPNNTIGIFCRRTNTLPYSSLSDDLYLFDRILTENEVTALYNE